MSGHFQLYKKRYIKILYLLIIAFFAIVLTTYYARLARLTPEEYFLMSLKCFEAYSSHDLSMDCSQNIAREALSIYKASDLLASIKNETTGEKLYCHDFSHSIGATLYEINGGDINKSIEECSEDCFDGCPHSVMETYLRERYGPGDLDKDSIVRDGIYYLFVDICKTSKKDTFYRCYDIFAHAFGHVSMEFSDYDLNSSLHLCDILGAPDSKDYSACHTGVLMAQSGLPQERAVRETLFDSCEKVDQKYRFICYHDRFKAVLTDDYVKNIEICSDFMLDFRYECFGRINIGNVVSVYDVYSFKDICNLLNKEDYRMACIGITAYQLATSFMQNLDKAYTYCSILSSDKKFFCEEQVKKRVLEIDPSMKSAL